MPSAICVHELVRWTAYVKEYVYLSREKPGFESAFFGMGVLMGGWT